MNGKLKLKSYSRTDSGNAELFADVCGKYVRFDHKRGRWLIWDLEHSRWFEDGTGQVRQLVKGAARQRLKAAAEISDDTERKSHTRWALESESRYRIDAALELAKSIQPIADNGRGWDAEPLLFSASNGVIDLQTGKGRRAKQEDHITLYSPVQFDSTAKCPRFERFILEICNGDPQLAAFIQRAIGYSLTGCVDEQCAFFCYGTGANGKSTLLNLLHYIFGNYAVNLPFSALELTGRGSIPNDTAMLAGRRFATAIETRESVRLNEARIKAITGGDPITARHLYHEHFTFNPTHKLWLAFNHKPIIADESEGMWRRVRLIPFTRNFSGSDRDNKLLGILKAEAPGILAWAVRGSLQWQREGLGEPQAVKSATSAYRAESDHVEEFIGECCGVEPSATVTSAALRERYINWTTQNEETPLSQNAFAERLRQRGLQKDRDGHAGTRTWRGIRLIEAVPSPEQLSEVTAVKFIKVADFYEPSPEVG